MESILKKIFNKLVFVAVCSAFTTIAFVNAVMSDHRLNFSELFVSFFLAQILAHVATYKMTSGYQEKSN